MSDNEEERPLLNHEYLEDEQDKRASNSQLKLKNIIFLGIYLFIWQACHGSIFSMQNQYIYHRFQTDNNNSNHHKEICKTQPHNKSFHPDTAQEEASKISFYYGLIISLPSCLFVLLYGPISDQIGRKWFLCFSWFCYVVQAFVFCLMTYFTWTVYLSLYAAVLLSLGKCTFPIAFAMLADFAPRENRNNYFAVFELIDLLGVSFSNLVTGTMLKYLHFAHAGTVIASVFFLSGVLFLFIPESRITSSESRTISNLMRVSSEVFTNYKLSFLIYSVNKKRGVLILLLLISLFVSLMTIMGLSSIDILYVLGSPFCFSSFKLGLYRWLKYFIFMISVLISIFLNRKFYIHEVYYIIAGLLSLILHNGMLGAAYFISQPFADYVVFFNVILGCCLSFSIPYGKAALSKSVTDDEQGALSGNIGVIENLSSVIGLAIINPVYIATLSSLPSTVYFCVSAMGLLIGLPVIFLYRYLSRKWFETLSPQNEAQSQHNSIVT